MGICMHLKRLNCYCSYALHFVGCRKLGGTAGQPDAGSLSGSGYTLDGGFWGGARFASQYHIYLPLDMK